MKEGIQDPRVDPNHKNEPGSNALCCASEKGHQDVVKILLASYPKLELNGVNNYGATSLFRACEEGFVEVVELLINFNGIDVNKPDSLGSTPFLIACQEGYIDIVKLLLKDERIDINQPNNEGETPLISACRWRRLEVIQAILGCGREVNITAKDNGGKSSIDRAIEKNHNEMVELLESFQRNPNETRTKLRKQLGLSG